jgi:hypothetical protein
VFAILVLMAFDSDQQQAIFLSTISAAFIVGAGVFAHRHRILNGPLTRKASERQAFFSVRR